MYKKKETKKFKEMEATFTYIKPDAYKHRAKIKKMIRDAGYLVFWSKYKFQFTRELAEKFYQEHKGRPYFEELIQHTCSGPVIPMILYKVNAIKDFREFIGATKPENAKEGSIRKLFGTPNGGPKNAIHGSDSNESFQREVEIIFG